MLKERPSPSVPAKRIVTQSIAPSSERARTVGSSAKLKTTATSAAKVTMVTTRSRERISSRRSLPATAATCPRNRITQTAPATRS
jgi:hypothetical protein